MRARLQIAGIVGTLLWLAACIGDPAQNPAWTLAGHPGLLYWIKFYYERNALEENGRCSAPLLEGVSRSEVLAEDQDQLVVSAGLPLPRRSSGTSRGRHRGGCRSFANARGRQPDLHDRQGEDGPTVASMNGPQKRRRAPAPAPQ